MLQTRVPVVAVKAGGEKRLKRGHPWVFSNEIEMSAEAKALPRGSVVRLVCPDGSGATALFNPHTLIAGRVLTADETVVIDGAFLRERIANALALRERLYDRPFYRLIHAEGDGLPGLIIDRYGDVLVVQANTAGMDRLLPDLLSVLEDQFSPAAIVLRNDSAARQTEGLEQTVEIARGEVKGDIPVEENGLTYLANVTGGQKTGWFYDHRDNRAAVARLAPGARVLDLYCHTGAFALACAAAGASHVAGVDGSATAIGLAERAATKNGLQAEFRKADVFAALDHFARTSETFDIVVADPPAFVKSRKDLQSGSKGYRKLARLAAGAVAPGGILVAASCSHLVDAEALRVQVARGVGEAGRTGRVLAVRGAGADHPVHLNLPETAYLKALIIALD